MKQNWNLRTLLVVIALVAMFISVWTPYAQAAELTAVGISNATTGKLAAVGSGDNIILSGTLNAINPTALVITVSYDAMTDNTPTVGAYLDAGTTIPAGSVVIAWKAAVTTGFTGDTSAVVQVGTSSSATAFSADTNESCYTSSTTVGSAAVAATAFCAAATTPRVYVNTAASWSSVSDGAMTVTIYYATIDP